MDRSQSLRSGGRILHGRDVLSVSPRRWTVFLGCDSRPSEDRKGYVLDLWLVHGSRDIGHGSDQQLHRRELHLGPS